MYDAGPLYATDAREAGAAMGNEGIDESARGMGGSWVHGQSLGFVDDDQVVVLVYDP